jgi:hypothetical protein
MSFGSRQGSGHAVSAMMGTVPDSAANFLVRVDHGSDLLGRGSVSIACPQAHGNLIRAAGQVNQHAAPVSGLEREFGGGTSIEHDPARTCQH